MDNTQLARRQALPLFRYPIFFGPGGLINCVIVLPSTPGEGTGTASETCTTSNLTLPAISSVSVLLACVLWLLAVGAVTWFVHGGPEMRPVAAQLCWLIIPIALGYTVSAGVAVNR